ncbi:MULTISPECIES: hypothetical protein [Halocynthiibacter]|uniref:Uncharacterized protein n=1 Tax=Halocynthiibacter halioticoli TaxID=2986804 RepID=A0AAE3IZV9_9RHOB|nr:MULTISPECIES: hypothetical protein [Halocynthiibacter]MCV6825397.1 hypothetical protein [Halocynthiibacter halioticoli]MCW4058398.1 hypothetical protein [Halocynthiibacter sp. SDUM655004]
MMIGWSRHMEAPEPRIPIDYALAPSVLKPGVGNVARTPAPELLHGRPQLLLSTLHAITTQTKIRTMVLSFHEHDIDQEAFNRGDPALRQKVARVLFAVDAFAHAGIPQHARLPFMVTTHTHAKRFELNVLWPRCVMGGHGRPLNINQHSLSEGTKAHWNSLEDFLNHHFGFADPRDPERKLGLTGPDKLEKEVIEATRAGITFGPDRPREMVVQALQKLRHAKTPLQDMLNRIGEILRTLGWGPQDIPSSKPDKDALLLGAPGAPRRDGVVVTGLIMDGPGDEAKLQRALRNRQAYLDGAAPRLVSNWQRRVSYNHRYFGKGNWPAPRSAEEIVAMIGSATNNTAALPIPRVHPDFKPRPALNISATVSRASALRGADVLLARLHRILDHINARRQQLLFDRFCAALTPQLTNIATQLESRHDRRTHLTTSLSAQSAQSGQSTQGRDLRSGHSRAAGLSDQSSRAVAERAGRLTSERQHRSGTPASDPDRYGTGETGGLLGVEQADRREVRDTGAPAQRTSATDKEAERASRRAEERDEGANTDSATAAELAHGPGAFRPDKYSRGERLKAAHAALQQIFPGELFRMRFWHISQVGEVLAIRLAGGVIVLTTAELLHAKTQIPSRKLAALGAELGLSYLPPRGQRVRPRPEPKPDQKPAPQPEPSPVPPPEPEPAPEAPEDEDTTEETYGIDIPDAPDDPSPDFF